jgi:hypothetical protein
LSVSDPIPLFTLKEFQKLIAPPVPGRLQSSDRPADLNGNILHAEFR